MVVGGGGLMRGQVLVFPAWKIKPKLKLIVRQMGTCDLMTFPMSLMSFLFFLDVDDDDDDE